MAEALKSSAYMALLINYEAAEYITDSCLP